MIEPVHPAFIFILGGLLLPLLGNFRLKQAYLLILPVLAFMSLYSMPHGTYWTYRLMDYSLTLGRVDALSIVFGYIFIIFAFCAILYALHVKEDGQQLAGCLYVGSGLGVVFAGDLISLYIFWELMAVASAVLIFYGRTRNAIGAGMRYILVHAAGGISLLAGIAMYMNATGSYAFNHIDFGTPGAVWILLGFLVNAAVPPLHAWLPDSYPEASVTGTVFLAAFTTKSAVYVLLRGFPGLEMLVWLGAAMTLYGAIYAVIENDIRRILAYSTISQVGYMVAGAGIGTMLAINGSTAHAFSHILYKGLLFMGAGAVILMTGKSRLTGLGGLYRYMPMTLALYIIGALSISAFPLFSGFVSKSMILSAAGDRHLAIIWVILTLASTGTVLHTGLRLPYFTFFSKDTGPAAHEPPANMLLAMGLVALLSIFVGVYPAALYSLLPYPVDYVPYTGEHITGAVQLIAFTALGFFLLRDRLGAERTLSLDIDWFYRRAGRAFMWFIQEPLAGYSAKLYSALLGVSDALVWISRNPKKAFFMQVYMAEYRLFGRMHGLSPEASLEHIHSMQGNYPGRPVHRDPVGDAIIIAITLLMIYALYYIVRLRLWT